MEDDQIMQGFLSSSVVLGHGWAAKSTVWALLKNQHVEMMFWNATDQPAQPNNVSLVNETRQDA